MALVSMSMFSAALHMDTNLCVYLPEPRTDEMMPAEPDRTYPVLYLLHGMREDQTCWVRKSVVELVARERNVVVVMPTTGTGNYVDQVHGSAWLTYLAEELPVKMANYFPVSTRREDTFIAGNSMGGYGALRAALGYPDRYAAAASFSGALQPYEEYRSEPIAPGALGNEEHMRRIREDSFGTLEEYLASDNNLVNLAAGLRASDGPKPRLFLCCGTDDILTYSHVCAFREKVAPYGLEYEYSEGPGRHDFAYWNPMIEPVFDFFGLTRGERVAWA